MNLEPDLPTYFGIYPESPERCNRFGNSDHLGSSSFITDVSGNAIQHLQYLPFGETWVDQQSSSWTTPYKFSGKEKDEETGYSYFGARYYDSDLSIWLSVDPMADERSWVSPYNYCQWNPINRVDPTGMVDEEPLKNVILVIRGNDQEYQKIIESTQKGQKYENWKVIIAEDIIDGNKQLKEYLGDSKLDNLVISSHGSASGMSITPDYEITDESGNKRTINVLDIYSLQEYNRYKDAISKGEYEMDQNQLNSILALGQLSEMVNIGGNIVLTACYAGEAGFAKEIKNAFNLQSNIFSNLWAGTVIGMESNKVRMGKLSNGGFIDHNGNNINCIEIFDNKQKPIKISSK